MTVTIRRDEWGVPHVTADDLRDAFFGVGWAQAEDHFPLVLRTYRFLAGGGADALGQEWAAADAAQHRWQHLERTRARYDELPQRLRTAAEGFVDGLRAYAEQHPEQVPDWAPELEPALPLAVYRSALWSFMVKDALEAMAAADVAPAPELLAELAATASGDASNACYLSARRTADGAPVLLSDPHGSITGFPMFEVRIRTDGLDAIGVACVGAAVPLLGHTRGLAWGLTTGAPRVSDCLTFELGPGGGYLVGDRERPIVRRSRMIGGARVTVEEVAHNGLVCPVGARSHDRIWVIATPYADRGADLDAFALGLLCADTVAQAQELLSDLGMFPQNLLVVDADDSAWYVRAGRVPVRPAHVDPSRPYSGGDAENRWQGVHPVEDLVQVGNPACGWLQNDNVAPDAICDGDLDGLRAGKPDYLFNDVPGRSHVRARRHADLLRGCTAATQQQLHELALDDLWPSTPAWQDALRRAAQEQPDGLPLLTLLLDFDGHAAPESRGALAWWYWRTSLGETAVATEELRALCRRVQDRTPPEPGDAELLMAAVTAAAQWMAADGAIGKAYGDVFRVGRGDQSWPSRGGAFPAHAPTAVLDYEDLESPVRVMVHGEPDGDGRRWVHSGGRSLRLVQFTDPIRSWSVVLHGQSSRPESPHFSDQSRLCSQALMRSTHFEEEELVPHVVSTTVLPTQSFPARLADLAAEHADRPAVILARRDRSEQVLTYRQLLASARELAPRLVEDGAGAGTFVVVALPNCVEHYIASYATWMAGACVLPLHPEMPATERAAVLELAGSPVVVGAWPGAVPTPAVVDVATAPALPDVVPEPGKAIGSGGSTGRPKIIVDPTPWSRTPGSTEGLIALAGMRPGQVQLVPGGLFHNTPFGWSHFGLFDAQTVVVMEKFDAEHALELIERHGVGFMAVVPTVLARMARVPDFAQRDLSSLEGVLHTASSCPAWVKRAWIDAIGAERVVEAYGSSDYIGACVIRGDEWLEHPGSVGRPADCELRILGGDGQLLPAGEVGEIYMRLLGDAPPAYSYVGAVAKQTPDGFTSVGDLGWLDGDGYLFLADRRVDLIVSGGANVYPAEVEEALSEHPGVADCAVIGLPDEEWVHRVHAIVQPGDPSRPPSADELAVHARERLAPYKRPKSYEIVDALPRNEAGKIRRSDLVAERTPARA